MNIKDGFDRCCRTYLTQILIFVSALFFSSCKSKYEKAKPSIESVSESIYASGLIKSRNQYQAFVTVNGTINSILVSEGDTVKKGALILTISNEAQRLGKDNAQLSAEFADLKNNQDKLNDAKSFIALAKIKMENDSTMYFRQKELWDQKIGTEVELEQKQLAYQNSKSSLSSANIKYKDLKRQLSFTSSQAKKNLAISTRQESDYALKSKIDGIVYSLPKSMGEIVSPQTPLALIGDASKFILEMQVDEYDILKIKKGLLVLVTLDSYKGKVFEAQVTKIYPIMNEKSKTFLVEAEFKNAPAILYPNISFEANIIIQTKSQAILIPRNYLLNDSIVLRSNGDTVIVKTGLKDYKKIEIISGLSANDELRKPKE
ncbi:MAG: efflux RND transporter periplasmic adaptor subunit [Opitutaceae bacterium]|nr:efflux RND transporter periplasmic adaptor subunit [Cytophagales bacterium]